MAITIKRAKNERGVKLSSLNVGDTFLYDNRVGVVVERNGHGFYLDLTTCRNFRHKFTRPLGMEDYGAEIPPETIVLPVEVEMVYKVVG